MVARLIYLAVLLASVLLLGLSMYYQHALRLQPCGALVLVRYGLVFVALLALVALAIGAGKIVRIVMSAGIGLVSLVGAAAAGHQSWPRHVPFDLTAAGVSVRSLPLADVLPRFFVGGGDCGKARWNVLGIAASEWAFVAFLVFIAAAVVAARRD